MALLKHIEVSNTGLEAGYWRIGKLEHHPGETNLDANQAPVEGHTGIVDLTMYGYADKAARDAGKAFFIMAPIRIAAASLNAPTIYETTAARIYEYLKTLPAFAGATDA